MSTGTIDSTERQYCTWLGISTPPIPMSTFCVCSLVTPIHDRTVANKSALSDLLLNTPISSANMKALCVCGPM